MLLRWGALGQQVGSTSIHFSTNSRILTITQSGAAHSSSRKMSFLASNTAEAAWMGCDAICYCLQLTAQVVAGQLPHQHQTHHHHLLHPQGQAGWAPATTTTSCNIQTHVYAEQRYACSYRQRLQTASACNYLQKQQLLHSC